MTIASVMVRLTAGASNDALLRFAVDAVKQFVPARVIGISACQPLKIYASPDAYVPADLIDQDLEQITKDLTAAEESFRSALEGKAKSIQWRSATITFGTISEYIAAQMRAADLLVVASEEEASVFDSGRHINNADLVLRVGRPVLVAGSTVDRLDLSSAVLAWKDTREARRAAEGSLPLLKQAGRVTVVEVAAKDNLDDARARTEDVTAWLVNHGIAASACPVGSLQGDAADLEAIAKQLGAGVMVGGAYGHTRVREWVLGGVTRDLLLRPTRCSMVSH